MIGASIQPANAPARESFVTDLEQLEASSRCSVVQRVSYPVDPMRRFSHEAAELVPVEPGSKLERVAALLEWSYGYVDSPRSVRGRPTRRAASAGALYPTETFVLAHVDGEWRFHYYSYLDHRYYRVPRTGLDRVAEELTMTPDDSAVLLTSVFWRSAQRYGTRCYLYCLLDAGNVVGNLTAAAAAHDVQLAANPLSLSWHDERQLGFRDGEGCVSAIVVRDDAHQDVTPPPVPGRIPTAQQSDRLQPPMLSPIQSRITRFHRQASALARLPIALSTERLGDFAETMQRRRSVPAFAGGPVGEADMASLIEICASSIACVQSDEAPEMTTWAVLIDVDGHDQSCHAIASDGELAETTRTFRGADAAELLRSACQGQAIVSGSALAVVIGMELTDSGGRPAGHDSYRTAALAAGMACSALYRDAARLGLGTTSIGGFYSELLCEIVNTDSAWPLAVQLFGVEGTPITKVDAAVLATAGQRKDKHV